MLNQGGILAETKNAGGILKKLHGFETLHVYLEEEKATRMYKFPLRGWIIKRVKKGGNSCS